MSQLPANPTPEETASPIQSKMPTVKHKFEGHERDISSFVFLHDNVHVVSSSRDGTMRKWDCDTGRLIGEPWKGEGRDIMTLALSPDGKAIACGKENGSVQRWDAHGGMIEDIWMGHSSCVRSLSWSPNGGYIASGSNDGTILIRNAESGEVEVGPIEAKQGGVCIMYVHFACGFATEGVVNPRTEHLLRRLARRDGWFVPVSTLLDFLREERKTSIIPAAELLKMEQRWAFDKAALWANGVFHLPTALDAQLPEPTHVHGY